MTQTTPFAAAFAQANLPGAVGLIVDRDGIRHAEALGHADVGSGAPMQLDTVCQIASMTKALVSAGAMQLVEQGRLDLDADVGTLLPELAKLYATKQVELRCDPEAMTILAGYAHLKAAIDEDWRTEYLDAIEGSVTDLAPVPTAYPAQTRIIPNSVVLPSQQGAPNPIAGALAHLMAPQPSNGERDAHAIQHMHRLAHRHSAQPAFMRGDMFHPTAAIARQFH